jgi:alkaline phosphatase D
MAADEDKRRKDLQPVAGGRRKFLTDLGGVVLAAPALIHSIRPAWAEDAASRNSLFTLGVASGDPRADSVVLWTRLAPDPLEGGGMRDKPLEVRWCVARNPDMSGEVACGEATAHPRNGHAVRVNVDGLHDDTWYYYQFKAAGVRSRIGRTRTFPAKGILPHAMRFALVSCQDYQAGYYAAYRDIAAQPLDFVVHTGDYIYEYAGNPQAPAERRHTGGETASVEDYRNRYALYRLDPDLQAAHAAFPFIVTFDDHEVDNNYAGLIPEDGQTLEEFRRRRANAYRVYRESMPLRPNVKARGEDIDLYRSLRYGDLAEIQVLDTRQYRTDQPCGDGLQPALGPCADEIGDPAATLLGDDQETWVKRNLRHSRAVWNVLAQQVMMMRWDLGAVAPLLGLPLPPGTSLFNVDAWDGYQAARDRLLRFVQQEDVRNLVVLTGDIHSSWGADLKADFTDASAPVIGAEFVCTSISSVFGDQNHFGVQATLPSNPHIRFFDGLHRGYALCQVNPGQWVTTFRAVQRPAVADPVLTVPARDLPVFSLGALGLTAGQTGLYPVV